MRRNENFILRHTADLMVILPVGLASVNFPGMISVNETGALLWELLAQEQTADILAEALTKEYEVEFARAKEDVDKFLEQLRPVGALVE